GATTEPWTSTSKPPSKSITMMMGPPIPSTQGYAATRKNTTAKTIPKIDPTSAEARARLASIRASQLFLRVHDAVPAPTSPQRHANVSRNQGAQCAPVPVIEEIHLVVLNPERFKKLRRLLRAVDPPAIGVVRHVRV